MAQADVSRMAAWVRKRLCLPLYSASMWNEQHTAALKELFSGETSVLVAYVDEDSMLVMSSSPAELRAAQPERFMYFVRRAAVRSSAAAAGGSAATKLDERLTLASLPKALRIGSARGAALEPFLNQMNAVFVPGVGRVSGQSALVDKVAAKVNVDAPAPAPPAKRVEGDGHREWPESVKRDFSLQLHSFMASLTETVSSTKNETMLYIPANVIPPGVSPDVAGQDKDLVQQLESTVIHWTQQVKEIVTANSDQMLGFGLAGPLAEIQFWRNHSRDINGLESQLQNPALREITAVLESARSSFLLGFNELTEEIARHKVEAEDNLKFLSLLIEPCELLARTPPSGVLKLLPRLLNLVRLVWSVSSYYNTEERLTGLLRKFSNEIILRCRESIPLEDIFSGSVDVAIGVLKQSIACGEQWRVIYDSTKASIAADAAKEGGSARVWDFDSSAIFAQIDAFVQRCRDLQQVCDAQVQFARRGGNTAAGVSASISQKDDGVGQRPLPVFPGSVSDTVVHSLQNIEHAFEAHVASMRAAQYDQLSVQSTEWHDDYLQFKTAIRELESMTTSAIDGAFESVETTTDAVDLLFAFHSIATRDSVRRCVEGHVASVGRLFEGHLAILKHEFEECRKNPHLSGAQLQCDRNEPKFAGAGLWALGLLARIDEEWGCVAKAIKLGIIGTTHEVNDMQSKYLDMRTTLREYITVKYEEWRAEVNRVDEHTSLASRLERPLLTRAQWCGQNNTVSAMAGALPGGEGGDVSPSGIKVASPSRRASGAGLSISSPRNSSSPRASISGRARQSISIAGRASTPPGVDTLLGANSPGGRRRSSPRQGSISIGSTPRNGVHATPRVAVVQQLLEEPIGEGALLESNFDMDLARLFSEVHYWEQFEHWDDAGAASFSTPAMVAAILKRRAELEVLRGKVIGVVRRYNQILNALSEEERLLLHEHTSRLDRRHIRQGLTTITWAHKAGTIEQYVDECNRVCHAMYQKVLAFKQRRDQIWTNVSTLENLRVIRIETGRVYANGAFEQTQIDHRAAMKTKLGGIAAHLEHCLVAIYDSMEIESAGDSVRLQWTDFIFHVDERVREAVHKMMMGSLQDLSRAVQGDARSDPRPFLLERLKIDKSTGQVVCSPSMMERTQLVNSTIRDMFSTIIAIPRLTEVLQSQLVAKREEVQSASPRKHQHSASSGASPTRVESPRSIEALPSLQSILVEDFDLLRVMSQIMNAIATTTAVVTTYVNKWTKYKNLWEVDKQTSMRRFAKVDRSLAQYKTEVMKYRRLQIAIQAEPSSHIVRFAELDNSFLKNKLVEYALEWQKLVTNLLGSVAGTKMKNLIDYMKNNTAQLEHKPFTLEQLNNGITLLRNCRAERSDMEQSFDALEEMYTALRKFDVTLTDVEVETLETFRAKWDAFEVVCDNSELMLDDSKANMRQNLDGELVGFQAEVSRVREECQQGLPTGVQGGGIAEAMEKMAKYTKKIEDTRKREIALLPGIEVFGLARETYQPLADTEKELAMLAQVWGLQQEWEDTWDGWRNGKFANLNPDSMVNVARGTFLKAANKLGRTQVPRVSSWPCFKELKDKLVKFTATMPLITDLKNPAMRTRHWNDLMDAVGQKFDPKSDTFTLAEVFNLGLEKHADLIGSLSSNANRELSIEQALERIETEWADVVIEMGMHKEVYYRIAGTEDLYQKLDDDSVALLTMKASRFYKSFKDGIDRWEHNLSHVSEVVELGLVVQQQWMYLESIFAASEDIRKQLPDESRLFFKVNKQQNVVWERLFTIRKAVEACSVEGTLETLQDMEESLGKISKGLTQYLETKRQVFPRFYFLSDPDLLEILGQQRDPTKVQKHIQACFPGIKKLDFYQPGTAPGGRNGKVEAWGMTDPKGEHVKWPRGVIIDGAVEMWLVAVERRMVETVQFVLENTIKAFPKVKKPSKAQRLSWMRNWPGMLLITGGKYMWTLNCDKALYDVEQGKAKAIKRVKKNQIKYLVQCSDIIRDPTLTSLDRRKIVTLITIEIHSRDVLERMVKANCAKRTDWSWMMQQRFYWVSAEKRAQIKAASASAGGEAAYDPNSENGLRDDRGEMIVRQTNTEIPYGYEYQGNNGRLVVTPLTDRCVLTLTTALHLCRGGNPLGPAGTGKTETVKDLGKNLAKYVVVFNCSDGLDYKSVGRMFAGLCQSGGWGCFDEFNRIEIEVLSVVATQILTIMNAISSRAQTFVFEGTRIKCNWGCGIFVTMNPGYAGRTPLPDNLKSLMRPVSMMTPDLGMIAEVMLMAEGFVDARVLGNKVTQLYALMQQQLTKQDHYDYGLRSLKAVLNCAGALKRESPDMNEDLIVLRALRDMNVPKFIEADNKLFVLLLGDLFPGLELPKSDIGALGDAIDAELLKQGMQLHSNTIGKIIQTFDSMQTRHCNMLVGHTLGGKSVVWKTLRNAKIALAKAGNENFKNVLATILNPKSVTMDELYGNFDRQTMEWMDGVLSTLFRTMARDGRPIEQWLVLDGPVDTLWIESMNTVMDDNKTLTLINGDRITMSEEMALVFETLDLSVASPATVSRAGMIYLDVDLLGWAPFVASWIMRLFPAEDDADDRKRMNELFAQYVAALLLFRKERKLFEPVPVTDFAAVRSLCNLYDCCNTAENGLDKGANPDKYFDLMEKWFLFSTIWSIGGAVDDAGRSKFDDKIRDLGADFPPANTVFDYFVDVQGNEFKSWDTKVPERWRPPADAAAQFFKIIVPTIDTERNKFVIKTLLMRKMLTLVGGATGTGKTVVSQQLLNALPSDSHGTMIMNFSSATTAATTQDIVESYMEKRSKNKLGPKGGKQLVCFVDDLNMPKKEEFGAQPPLEILREWIDYGGWYDRGKCAWRFVLDMQLLCSMAPPGGGRSVISERMQSRFNLINFTTPKHATMVRIFKSILIPHLEGFDDEVKPMSGPLIEASVDLYHDVQENFLPTPSKCHYLFNMRDLAKVTLGLLQSNASAISSSAAFKKLWAHEASRVFSDRFTDYADLDVFRGLMNSICQRKLDDSLDGINAGVSNVKKGAIFVSFMSPEENAPYAEAPDVLKMKRKLEDTLEDYSTEPGMLPMGLVLFDDAIRHIARISRVIKQPRGNCMLIGIGGSGRQSLTRLAAYASGISTFAIEITKNYRSIEFREDIKKLMYATGVKKEPTVFLFNDTQIKEPSFLEDINNILSTGEIPNLYEQDEIPPLMDEIRADGAVEGAETAAELWHFFVARTRQNLHVVLCMSPVGDNFRNRCRMYPSLVSCTTMDFFFPWPADALKDVAQHYLADTEFAVANAAGHTEDDEESGAPAVNTEKLREDLGEIFALVHQSVEESSVKMLAEQKRPNYVTPTHYLELVVGYQALMKEKREFVGGARDKLANGLSKLAESSKEVQDMSIELAAQQIIVTDKSQKCEVLLVDIVAKKKKADEKKRQVEAQAAKVGAEKAEAETMKAEAQGELDKAMPMLYDALAKVECLNRGHIAQVKGYADPHRLIRMTGAAVLVLFGNNKADWSASQKKLGQTDFLRQVMTYDKDNISPAMIKRLDKFVQDPEFQEELVNKKSEAAGALCVWVHAMHTYAMVNRTVEPKKLKVKRLEQALMTKEKALAASNEILAQVVAQVQELENTYNENNDALTALQDKAESLSTKLRRADNLVSGLAGEGERWELSIERFTTDLEHLAGDCLIAAAFISYCGPFDAEYRQRMTGLWFANVVGANIPMTKGLSVAGFLSDDATVQDWNVKGLPRDTFSTENGVMVTRGRRWPLMVDPQGQANSWIKRMQGSELKVTDLGSKNFLRLLENAIAFGTPYLLQDVEEELDPAFEPVLSKAIIKIGNRQVIRIGDKELDYSNDFKFYMSTKLANPHYPPEISTKTLIINFSVKEQGLREQLLGTVVELERPELQKQKQQLVEKIASDSRKMVDLENLILKMLAEVEGSLLDDEQLVITLQDSKTTSEAVSISLKEAVEKEAIIDTARSGFKPVSARAALLYFVLNDLTKVDPMYQWSLASYVSLFQESIISSRTAKSSTSAADVDGESNEERALAARIMSINDFHTYSLYNNTCLGLFERHKIMLSFMMCIGILRQQGRVAAEEFSFFLKGGIVMDRSDQRVNPCDTWMAPTAWDQVMELDKLSAFKGIGASFEQYARDWYSWWSSARPEDSPLPGDWDSKLGEMQKCLVLRCLRMDRIVFAMTKFVANSIGSQYITPPEFDLGSVFSRSKPAIPLLFILSPGVDPTRQVSQFGLTLGKTMETCSLGQGQDVVATAYINAAVVNGSWVFLANCHLMTKWLPTLSKMIDENIAGGSPHEDFRLWLSSNPTQQFPIDILRGAIKMTTEPPQGLRANMLRLYNLLDDNEFEGSVSSAILSKYKKLLFSLCWFHSILLERKKFKSLGLNVPYDFNDSDFQICKDILKLYLGQYTETTPWDALRYLTAQANYGGRVTDFLDRRLVNTYIEQFYCEEAVTVPAFKLSSLDTYEIPPDGPLDSYKLYIRDLAAGNDDPGAFGQHANADISYLQDDGKDLLITILSLQDVTAAAGGQTIEEIVLAQVRAAEADAAHRHVVPLLPNFRSPPPFRSPRASAALRFLRVRRRLWVRRLRCRGISKRC